MADRLSWDLQYDEQGRPFYATPDHPQRRYVSPVAMGTGQRPEDTTSIFHKRPEWNAESGQWDTPFDWGNLLNIGVGAGLGAGVIDAAMAAGGGAAGAGGGAAASASGPTGLYGAVPPAVASHGVSAGLGAGAGTAANIAGNAANSFLGGDKGSMLRNILGLGTAGLGALNSMRQPQANKQIEDMLGIATDRVNSSKPLFDALQSMAMQGLPTYAKGNK